MADSTLLDLRPGDDSDTQQRQADARGDQATRHLAFDAYALEPSRPAYAAIWERDAELYATRIKVSGAAVVAAREGLQRIPAMVWVDVVQQGLGECDAEESREEGQQRRKGEDVG